MEGIIMTVASVESGVIKQVWHDVKTPAELKKKYSLSGAGYRAIPNAVVGQIEQNGGFVDPLATHVPQPAPDRDAAIRALIAGDIIAAQAAMDKME